MQIGKRAHQHQTPKKNRPAIRESQVEGITSVHVGGAREYANSRIRGG